MILAGIKPLEERFRSARQAVEIHLQARRGSMSVGLLQQALGWRASRVKQLIVRPGDTPDVDDVVIALDRLSSKDAKEITARLSKLPSVLTVQEARP